MFRFPLGTYAGLLVGVVSTLPLTACSLIVDPDDSLLGGGDGVRILDSGTSDEGVGDGAVPSPDSGIPDAIVPPTPDATVVEPGPYRPANATREIWMEDARDVSLGEGRFLFDSSECEASMSESAIVEQREGGEFCVIWAQDFTIEEDAVLEIRGRLPVAIIASGSVQIDGTIDVSADGTNPGAGGYSGARSAEEENGRGPGAGRGGEHEGTYDDGGGGGGAFCGDGGDGGEGGPAVGGRGGRRVESSGLEPLFGGSGGGRGRGSFIAGATNAGYGGSGGGAIQISALEEVTINGRIVAAGGGGLPGSRRVRMRNWGSGGGGGAGGGVLLQAPTIRLSDGASINIAGGGGGGGAGGRRDGEPGQNGSETLGRVSGGESGGEDYGSEGGDGAGGDRANGQDGDSNERGGANGGGGGGGSGCLVLRTNGATLGEEFRVSPGLESIVQRLPLES